MDRSGLPGLPSSPSYGRDGKDVAETWPRTWQLLAMVTLLPKKSRAPSRPPSWQELHGPELDNPAPGCWNSFLKADHIQSKGGCLRKAHPSQGRKAPPSSPLPCDLSTLPDACLQHGASFRSLSPRAGAQAPCAGRMRASLPRERAKPGSQLPGVISHL